MKIVINRCYGGFSLSPTAAVTLFEEGWKELGTPVDVYYGPDRHADKSILGFQSSLAQWRRFKVGKKTVREAFCLVVFSADESNVIEVRPKDRSDKRLVELVERLGKAANGSHADLKVIEIPGGVEWSIEDYDGMESVHEVHREWR